MRISTSPLLFIDNHRFPSEIDWMEDDSRVYIVEDWDIVRDYDEFVNYIDATGVPSVVSFGYKLSKNKTGYNCAEYLIEYCIRYDVMPPVQLCHSKHKSGKKKINVLWDKFINILFKPKSIY